ncbi:MAG: flavin reductase family protein [Acidimicrobiales bacterium]
MSMKKTSFVVADLDPVDSYKLATGLIVPRPIGWIGTVDEEGVSNLAPFSFFNVVAGHPPTVVFAPASVGRKDTLDNVKATGEFTVNVVTIEVVEAMNASAATVAAEVDEFELSGVTAVASDCIAAPMVAESKANFECVVTHLLPIGQGRLGGHLVVGEAVMVHVADQLLDGTRVDQAELKAVGRHVGNWYSSATNLFEIERPD